MGAFASEQQEQDWRQALQLIGTVISKPTVNRAGRTIRLRSFATGVVMANDEQRPWVRVLYKDGQEEDLYASDVLKFQLSNQAKALAECTWATTTSTTEAVATTVAAATLDNNTRAVPPPTSFGTPTRGYHSASVTLQGAFVRGSICLGAAKSQG